MSWFDDWALTLAVFVPLVGMAVVLLIPRAQEQAIKVTALLASVVTAGVGIGILADFDYGAAGKLQFQANEPWIDVIKSRYHVGVDGIGLPLLILTMLVVVACVIYSWDHFPEPYNPKAFLALVLLLEVGMNGTFVAQDLILFFIFFEIVLLPMFFMIGVWGGPNREYASIKFFLFTLFGSALMLLSFLALFFLSDPQTFDIPRLADQGADVPVPHVAARRAHRGADGGLGAAGGGAPEARLLRVHPDRAADPAPGRARLGAVDRAPRRDRDHLRRTVLPRSTRHEETHRVLVGGAHGVHHAWHRDAHELRHQRRHLRDGRPRAHHRHAVLPRGIGAGALRDARDQPAGRAARPGAEARVDPRVLRDGVARAPRTGWVLGRVPGDPVRVQPGGRRVGDQVPRVHGGGRGRHGARRRLPAVDVPAGGVRQGEDRVRAHARPRRALARVDRVDAAAHRHRGARHLSEPHLPDHRRR